MQNIRIQPARSGQMSDLFRKTLATQKAGIPLTVQNANRVFGRGHDARFRNSVVKAAQVESVAFAIKLGVITDYKVIDVVLGMGEVPSSIVLALESKLGRHLSRNRIYVIKKAYQGVLDRKKIMQFALIIFAGW